jgi:signal transduction histidine kinase
MPKIKKSTEDMTRIILLGSFLANLSIITLLLLSLVVLGNTHVTDRLLVGVVSLIYLGIVSFVIRHKHPKLGAWMLVILYGGVGLATIIAWGINTPIGILVMGFVIILSSVMLGSRHIPAVTLSAISSLVIVQSMSNIGVLVHENLTLKSGSNFGDVGGYSVVFAVFAVIAWMSGRKAELALTRAVAAENELHAERDALAVRVQEQTNSIKAAQQKELNQLYKFAELGQLTTIILHELANHLSVLTLDIEDLKERHHNSLAIDNAKESISHIDSIIDQVRNQIMNSDDIQDFDALDLTRTTLDQLKTKLRRHNVQLFTDDTPQTHHFVHGDPLRLSQAITILVTNSVQASSHSSEILVSVGANNTKILISVKDFGAGISPASRRVLFKPRKSKKGGGLGIGLYITKQIIETHFKGRLWLDPAITHTQFNIELPLIKRRPKLSNR